MYVYFFVIPNVFCVKQWTLNPSFLKGTDWHGIMYSDAKIYVFLSSLKMLFRSLISYLNVEILQFKITHILQL